MEKYLAKIVYKIVNQSELKLEQFDEQLCLVEARSLEEAFFKARMLGVKNEDEITTDSGNGVFWEFVDVPYLKLIEEFKDGTELYSCISERDKEDNYERFVKTRAAELQNQVGQPQKMTA
ncbi:MAG: DUF4288 domain-containing protein [Bacteroidia bacterium]|nr:DUF4288 domain-containing protein [Bacteroidia bacterium]MCF8426939.1 DUF4288 domain-containing protein [Bacteroidia bacterium]MCF8446819.1 DUF4288 domain-containing protein [Bacteroidia bacterium]